MKVFDIIFKLIYTIQCYILILVLVSSLAAILYSKIFIGRILYYGVPDLRNTGHQNFFDTLSFLHNTSLLFVIVWPFFAFIIFATEKYRNSTRLVNRIGVVGFISNLIFLIADPFGIWKYFDD